MSRINTNVTSLVGRNNLQKANSSLSQSLTRLSTGLRINTGKDDPAGLIASENLRSDITSIRRAISNTDRANQVIATADSALGQVSSLLNDIRGLVTESANNGALSDEQIAANQLQVDSSLEALNRIAQTTTFQGRRLLDGSLDFLTSTTDSTDFQNVSNLQIDQANLGATGSVDVDVSVSTAATQAQVDIAAIPASTTPAKATADLDFTLAQTSTPGSVTAGGTFAIDDAAEQSAGTIVIAGETFDVAALAGGQLDGVAGDSLTITLTDNDSGAAANVAIASAVLTGTSLEITGDFSADSNLTAGEFASQVDAIIGSSGTGDASIALASGGTASTAIQATTITSQSYTGGVNAITDGAATFSATTAAGENIDLTFSVATSGAGTGVTIGGNVNDGYTVEIGQNYDGDLDTIANAINTGISEVADAAFSANLDLNVADGDNATTITNAVNITGGSSAGANGTLALNIETVNNTAAYNGLTFTVSSVTNASSGTDTDDSVTATLNGAGTDIAIDIVGDVTGQAILDAINGVQDADGNAVVAATLDATTSGSIDLDDSFVQASDTVPSGAALDTSGDNGGGLTAAVVFELAGADGSEVLSFGEGTSIADLVAGINLVSDATGVEASLSADTLQLQSSAYGSDSFVDINVISEGSGTTPAGTFTTAVNQGTREEGTDIVASINGVKATGDGNNISINTATLDLSATIDPSFTGTASFTITGGGAKFQLGPDVVSNQQARLGIGSVNTAQLGGNDGLLFQLGSGGSADLSSDPGTAAKIVESAIDQVTSLRGRLGAFQRTSLETNRNALNDTLTNLTEAESAIRDADFAVETANLTRSQILVQSGTRVLAIANQNPQNVLSLLG